MFEPIKVLNVLMNSQPIGRLAMTPERLAAFEYSPEFLGSGFSISPFQLALKPGLFIADREPFAGNFGVFNDSLPDGWGNLLLDRFLHSQGVELPSLSVLDRLSLIGSGGLGALQYEPDNQVHPGLESSDLDFLAGEVAKVLSETEYSDHLELLVNQGAAPGGARPKILLKAEGNSWIVKFPSTIDPTGMGEIEYQYSLVARNCGIQIPETKLFENKYFGIKRFDRVAGQPVHMLSASGLLNASHRYPSLDYTDLIKASNMLTRNIENSYRLFRLMVFNVLTANRDDHAKNFAFLYKQNEWGLSPAYDLVPSSGFNGNHSTTIAGKGKPTQTDIFEVGKQTGLDQKRLRKIFDEVFENCAPIRKVQF